MKKLLVLLALAAAGLFFWEKLKPPVASPGAYLNTEPAQRFSLGVPFKVKNYSIFTLADFQIDAQVLGSKQYNNDENSDISPVDLALGWGPLANKQVLADISVSQEGRFYYFTQGKLPITIAEIARNSANVHIIPASSEIEKFVSSLRAGELVSLKGRLVSVHRMDGWHWFSSLTRNDTGDGACELMYVENASKIDALGTKPPAQNLPGRPPRPVADRSQSQALSPPRERIILSKTLVVRLRYGSLTIPAGESLDILQTKAGKINVAYRGHEIWVDRSESGL